MTHKWLWPDRTIGKKESSVLRDEHNALVNSHAELLEALKEVTKYFGNVRFGEKGYTYDGVLIDMNEGAHKKLLEEARAAIAKAKEASCSQE